MAYFKDTRPKHFNNELIELRRISFAIVQLEAEIRRLETDTTIRREIILEIEAQLRELKARKKSLG